MYSGKAVGSLAILFVLSFDLNNVERDCLNRAPHARGRIEVNLVDSATAKALSRATRVFSRAIHELYVAVEESVLGFTKR